MDATLNVSRFKYFVIQACGYYASDYRRNSKFNAIYAARRVIDRYHADEESRGEASE